MSDLIRRCDVLDNINKRIYYFDKASFDEAVKAVYNAPSVDATPRWINVEDERKPRNQQECLCLCALDDDPEHKWDWQMVLRWHEWGSDGNGGVIEPHFTDEGVNGMYVTHWMPLPEPPKEPEA